MTRPERRRAAGLGAAILALHGIGFAILLLVVGPRAAQVGGLGIGITAYTLGLRHAFDADHIAAIDNTTRKLLEDGKRSVSVGFWFSLGHSSIVFAATLLLSFGLRTVAGGSPVLSVAGTAVSGTFLYLIGLVNLVALARALRGGTAPTPSGPITRLTSRFSRRIRAPWQMYPLGLLFGLGFDTASEISLLALAAGAAFHALPFYAVLCLPVLFAAGMSLLDTLDGAFMAFAYGWAFEQPARKRYYNLTVTGLSVAVALAIGTVELLSVTGIADVRLDAIGYVIAGLFAVTWLTAVAVWRLGRIEQRWAG
jgi:high-affinity nickel-transport protein